MKLQVLYEDNHLLVVNKPAGVLAQRDVTGDASLVEWVKAYRKEKEAKAGNVFVGLVHRLDRPVSGLIVVARTSKAADRLSQLFRQKGVEKNYLAIVERARGSTYANRSEDESGVWEDYLQKNPTGNQVVLVPPSQLQNYPKAKKAVTRWRFVARSRQLTLLELSPVTGRPHQLRVQTAGHGLPIYGDRKYGSRHRFDQVIALHSYRLKFPHPTRDEEILVTCPPPYNWHRFPFEIVGRPPTGSK